ncbi:tyrosine-type recombinase/integrase [Caulobacter sp. NIBR1757]|uniref:tyrosine-type recombinase/integrase n=1 Tax=Caulobacter sp. NIBR1757 TaxID=3016000 RepID=UPI0022F0E641|nr:tyrosine-type recombinase/integrase [Caulobacter sp. NIBR1757]WGM37528.1 Tyrosine recombinase XerC [Caulobacter sp. NIBR1757]
MAVVNLTEARIRDLPAGSGIWRDEQVKGLMVVCHKTTKTYAVQGDVRRNGRHIRTVRVKIDRCDRIGLRDARGRAKALMSQIQSGVDPSAGPDETGITLKQALDAHLSEKTFSPATSESYRYHVDKYLVRFRSRAVTDISRAEVREIYDQLKKQRGQTTASCAMRTLRAVINTAMRMDETISGNPVAALRVPTSNRRQVQALDLTSWWAEMKRLGPIRRDLHLAMLLTGARRSSILQVKRSDVDLAKGIITFRHMKTGGQMMFPIGPKLAAVLEARLAADEPLGSPWLWPSATSKCGRIVEPKEQRKDLPSPHEYRHHARTLFIGSGAPYAESALLLGQRLPGASGGYVHAEHLVEHLRPHARALEDLVFAAAETANEK